MLCIRCISENYRQSQLGSGLMFAAFRWGWFGPPLNMPLGICSIASSMLLYHLSCRSFVYILIICKRFVAVARKSANGVVSCCKASSLLASEHWKLLNSSIAVTESQPDEEPTEQSKPSRKRRKLS